MDRNFKVRSIVSFCMFVIVVISLYTFEAIPFKIIFGLFSIVAMIELGSFFKHKHNRLGTILACIETLCLVCGVIFVSLISPTNFWYIILGVPGYDIFAYLFGMFVGGKIFKKSRPFPKISKNKTWEGTIFGLIMSIGLVTAMMGVRDSFQSDWPFIFCGPLALIGDLLESYLKRKFLIKDSNEIVLKNKFFEKIELLVGGSEGHGGFLDRLDSVAFTATVLLPFTLMGVICF